MFLLQEMVERFRKGTWEADCVEMTLTQNDAATPARFVGQGYLRQESGTIKYKVYPSAVDGVAPLAGLQPLGVPGMLIGTDRYYRLETRTRDGVCWRVTRTLPDVSTSLLADGVRHIVGGEAREMTFTRPFGVELAKSYLTMVFFAEAEIPCNAVTETTSVVAGRGQTTSTLNVARFPTDFGEFCISRRDGMVIVEVEADGPFPPHFEVRIVEALGLVLARPLYWNVIERVAGGSESVRVRGNSVLVDAKLPRPVDQHGEIDMTGDVWRLFARYLSLVCTHAGDDFHPCSRHLFSVLEASAGAISARGLALGVAVEGIAKEMFAEAGAPLAGMKEVVPLLQGHCLAWPGMPDGDVGESLRRRLPGMIGQLLNVGTKDRLHALAKEKAIREAHIKSWSDLRNSSAHGVTPGSRNTQKLVDLCNHVTVLMYHLIFKATGYEGVYQDYSAHGWPMRRYRGRPVTEAEVAVAAYFIWQRMDRGHGHDLADWFAGKQRLEQGLA